MRGARAKLAKSILGYKLLLDVDRLEISDVDVTEDEVLVDLAVFEPKNLESNTYWFHHYCNELCPPVVPSGFPLAAVLTR
jgi:hypothetical protein